MPNTPIGQLQADRASLRKRLLSLAWPVIGLNVLQVLSLAVDTAMCGRLEHAEQALAALGFAGQLIFVSMVGMIGLTTGTIALVARAHGAGDSTRVNHILEGFCECEYLLKGNLQA